MLSLRISLAILSSLIPLTTASNCNCGFSVNSTSAAEHQLFTQYVETDFTKRSLQGQWIAQDYAINSTASRGPYGKNASSNNVDFSDEGLRLWVRPAINNYIPMAEVDSQRTDMLYGSFRMRAKFSRINGTCGAMFWYRNNTQEIDMEFLSKQFNETDRSNINLVIQSPQSEANGYNAAFTPGFAPARLDFRPDNDFHDYRFDWTPNEVAFYADNKLLWVMTENIPDAPGHMIFNHWSNGDPGWSAGPPTEDTYITISHAHFYFNSSLASARKSFVKSCPQFNATQVCEINADVTAALMPAYVADGAHNVKTIYIIVGVVVGLVMVGFIACMMTIRFWVALKNRIFHSMDSSKGHNPLLVGEDDKTASLGVKTPDIEMESQNESPTPRMATRARW